MNRFFFDSSLRSTLVLAFFAAGVASDSALRFLGAGASSSSLSSSSEDADVAELASLPDSSSEEAYERQYFMHLKGPQILLGSLLLWMQRSQACPSKPSGSLG